jgi:hypothetical protein
MQFFSLSVMVIRVHRHGSTIVFILELITTTGKLCEAFATYDEAKRRIDSFPTDAQVSVPLVFEELPDGSQRLVRDDGKHLQWHRITDDNSSQSDEPVSLCDDSSGLLGEGKWVVKERPTPQEEWEESGG